MSLYWHGGSKEELIDAMLDTIQAQVEIPDPTGDWRADLRALAVSQRAGLLQHPWVMDFIGNRPPSGPNDVRMFERSLALLDQIGLDEVTTIGVLMTIGVYVVGAVVREHQEIRAQRVAELAEADVPEQERVADQERVAEWFRKSGRYPHITRIMESGIDPDDPKTRDDRFEFGLNLVLNGIAQLPAPTSE
jgi:AcrR family transcriptional regulator